MAVEKKRGCGFRKIGGLYLVGGGSGVICDRLPLRLDVCPVCSHGFKQTRGFTWVDLPGLVGGVHPQCQDNFPCPLCMDPHSIGKAGLLWVGERFYKTPADFLEEGHEMGFSRRVAALPRNFKLGETWVMFAHPKTIRELVPQTNPLLETLADETPHLFSSARSLSRWVAGVFYLWQPRRLEKILPESWLTDPARADELNRLVEQGIHPVFVPDDDPDHRGTVYDSPKLPHTETTDEDDEEEES